MIPFVLIGGGLYLLFDALGERKKTFDPADFGLPTKGFRGYRKGAAHFAKGGETGKVGHWFESILEGENYMIDLQKVKFDKGGRLKKLADGGEVKVGKRVELIEMYDDPQAIEPGTKGTIVHIGGDVINVNWDNGRRLGLIMDVDKFKVIS